MALNRCVVGWFMLLFSACAPDALPPDVWVLPILGWLGCGAALFALLVLAPDLCAVRRILALVLDIGGNTVMLAAGGQATAFLYVVYHWIIIGNGYRFGGVYALAGSAASAAGFAIVIAGDSFWREHISLSMGLLSGLFVLPAYSLLLIRQLKKARQDAEQANKAKSLFLAGVSHELRNPLNAIVGTLELMRKTPLDAEQRAMVATINTAADGQLSLVDDVLALASGRTGQDRLNISVFDIGELMASVAAMTGPSARRKSLRFDTAVAMGTPALLSGDARRIREVLLNLCSNAVKFTVSGSVTLLVSGEDAGTSRGEAPVVLRFEVRDTGIGIKADAQARIFEPFTQADNTIMNRFGGTGLGLALCKRQVELMGGAIGVDSVPDMGSTFWVTLRVAHAPAREATQANADRAAPAEIPDLVGKRVLVADDNDINRTILGRMLKGAGLEVVFAVNGEQALAVLADGGVDAALLDVNMPVLDGMETAEMYAHSTLGGPRIPLIALTAGATENTRTRCLEAGMETVLAKPVRTAELLRVLADATSRQAGESTIREEPAEAAVDPERLHSLQTLGGPEFVTMLTRDFERDGSLLLSDIESACLGRDVRGFRTAAHSLASVSANMGATRIGMLCRAWQSIAETQFDRQRSAIPGQLADAWDETSAAFARWTGDTPGRRARM